MIIFIIFAEKINFCYKNSVKSNSVLTKIFLITLNKKITCLFTYHHLPRERAKHCEDLACADDRTLYKVSPLTVSLASRENSYRSDWEELAHPNSRHRIRNKRCHFYPKLLLISHDYPHRLLQIYSHALNFHNLCAWKTNIMFILIPNIN